MSHSAKGPASHSGEGVPSAVGNSSSEQGSHEELRILHDLYKLAFENASGIPYQTVFSEDAEEYVFIGQDIQNVIGIPPSELTPDRFNTMIEERLVVDPAIRLKEADYRKSFRNGEIDRYHVDLRLRTASGEEKWVSDCCVLVREQGTNRILGLLGILQDITSRKRAESLLRTAARMDATATLAGGIAHEFNNLLVGVLGNADLLLEGLSQNSEARTMIEQIVHSAKRASSLARQMLAFARGGKYQLESLDLNHIVQEILRLQQSTFPPGIEFRREFEPGLWRVQADSSQMREVIINLCLNAVEAIQSHGHIILTSHNVYVDDSHALLYQGLSKGQYVYLAVTDTGCGMSQETLSRVFEPFFTTKFPGRGLALAAAYGIVRNHGGMIFANSELGKGSKFEIFLPAEPIRSRSDTSEDTINLESAKAKGTILVVDGEPIILNVAERFLEKMGHRVLTARDGKSAIEMAASATSPIDVAILDYGLPRVNTNSILEELRRIQPKMRIIVATTYDLNRQDQELLQKGVFSFIQKPFRMTQIMPEIQRAITIPS